MEVSLRWLHGIYEDIEVPHHIIDASQSLHDVAKQVRMIVIKSMMRCSRRSVDLQRQPSAAPLKKWQNVGGVRGFAVTCSAGLIFGAVTGALLYKNA